MRTAYLLLSFAISIALASCRKQQFFEDAANPGLSRFTSRNYNVTSAYVNAEPWVSGFSALQGPQPMRVQLVTSIALKDTLYLTWSGKFSNPGVSQSVPWRTYNFMSICIPVEKNFSAANFLAWNGKSFARDTLPVKIRLSNFDFQPIGSFLEGKGNIYFVKVAAENNREGNGFQTSGLFEGNIGDSIKITKGRFDYEVLPQHHNLR